MFELDMHTVTDEMISNKDINPMVIVCPRIENSCGLNSSLLSKCIPNFRGDFMNSDSLFKNIIC